MSDTDSLILALYVIVVCYVLYQAFNPAGDQVEIQFDRDYLNQQLADRKLAGMIEIKFELKPVYQLAELKDLLLIITNNSTQIIYIDWDRSCLINLNKRSQRIVRIVPDMTFELLYTQALSVIAPEKNLMERFTTESVLERNKETGIYQLASGLIIKPRPPVLLPRYFNFSVMLALQFSDAATGVSLSQYHVLECKFNVNRLSLIAGILWNLQK